MKKKIKRVLNEYVELQSSVGDEIANLPLEKRNMLKYGLEELLNNPLNQENEIQEISYKPQTGNCLVIHDISIEPGPSFLFFEDPGIEVHRPANDRQKIKPSPPPIHFGIFSSPRHTVGVR